MLAAGDEIGHTQGGNNNAYCQDNAITWIDWSRADAGADRLHCATLLALRRQPAAAGRRAGTPACPTATAGTTWPGCAAPASR